MRRGALDLLNNYFHQKRAIAAAYVRGEIPKREHIYVKEVIDDSDIEAAKQTIAREYWSPELRLAQLESEVETLQAGRGQTRLLPEIVEDRRIGLVPYTIRVHNDDDNQPFQCDYNVLATRSLDARIIAFALDGGYGDISELSDFNVELAITWTEVL